MNNLTFRIVSSLTNSTIKEFEDFDLFKFECLQYMHMGADSTHHIEAWDKDTLIDTQEMNVYFDL